MEIKEILSVIIIWCLTAVVDGDKNQFDLLRNVLIHRHKATEASHPEKAYSLQEAKYTFEFESLGKIFSFDLLPKKLYEEQRVQQGGIPLKASFIKVTSNDGKHWENNYQPFGDFLLYQGPSDARDSMYGIFEAEGHLYRITEKQNFLVLGKGEKDQSQMMIAPLSSTGQRGKKCGTQELFFNKNQLGVPADLVKGRPKPSPNHAALRKGKQTTGLEVSTGCPVNPLQLPVALVGDCNYVKSRGGKAKAQRELLAEMNTVSSIFLRSYNIELIVSSVELLENCHREQGSFNVHCSQYPGLDAALNSFSDWRNGRDEHIGIYHLVTSCNYSDTVGLAWMNQVCRTQSFTDSRGDIISGTSMSVAIDHHYAIIAHELAHNLGAIHDCNSETCNGSCSDLLSCQCCACDGCNCNSKFIMEPENGGTSSMAFSTCTIKDVCDKLPYIGSCLLEQGTGAADLNAKCGNGIREGNEECDCGGQASCANHPCCTSDCKLKPGAQCSDSNDVCCHNCQIIPASSKQVCHVGQGPCQRDSLCNGKDASCPKPGHAKDGAKCDGDNACASGICTSRDAQCAIFGRHLNITKAYPYTSRSCTMICDGPEQAVDMNANFIDGTSCGQKGFCYNGMCSEFGTTAAASSLNARTTLWSTLLSMTIILLIPKIGRLKF